MQPKSLASVNVINGTAVSAPPGLGPPGVWVWPDDNKSKRTESDATAATEPENQQEASTISWPASSVDSVEVEFVGKSSQLCFGAEFIKMTVSWAEQWIREKMGMQIANLQLYLDADATSSPEASLSRLQAVLARDQIVHSCRVLNMQRSKENASMSITCSVVTVNTCWDVMKKGFCPRPGCTWQHPVPILLNVSIAGVSGAEPPLATLLPKVAADAVNAEKLKSEDDLPFAPNTASQQCVQLNMDAFDETDSSDEM
jgi:hypothetical protein